MSKVDAAGQDAGDLWLLTHLERAADRFGVTMTGRPVPGWGGRSLGVKVGAASGPAWLRVVTEHAAWSGEPFWTGNSDANAIVEVPKPHVRDWFEYDEGAQCFRAELMTYVDGSPCSPRPELRDILKLPVAWWRSLGAAVRSIAATSTERTCVTQADVTRRLQVFWGDQIDPAIDSWTTAHGDLHWANLLQPDLAVVDWEGWGTAPAGYDAATLHAYSLLVPDLATLVGETFQHLLDTRDGRRAELYAIARLLLRIEHGDHPDLAIPLHQRAGQLIAVIGEQEA